jgi:hypothetical protein
MSRLRTITTALAAVLLVAPAFAYDIQTPGNDTKLSVYGFAYGLANYYVTGAGQGGSSDLAQLGTTNQNTVDTKQVLLSTQASRYGFAAVTPNSTYGDITVKVEFDMNNGTQSNAFHLRHAYGTVGGFLMGQNWSNLVDTDAQPDSINWQGSVGDIGFDTPRRPQVRYTWNFDKKSKFAVSIEKNQGLDQDFYSNAVTGTGTSGAGGTAVNPQFPKGVVDVRVPAITAAYTMSDSWGHIKVGGLALYHGNWVAGANTGTATAPGVATAGQNTSKTTFTGFVSGDVKIAKDDLVFSFYNGAATDDWGIGEQGTYFTANAAGNVTANSYNDFGYMVGYTHVFTSQWRANVYTGGVIYKANSNIPTSQGATATDIKNYNDAAANVFYTFSPAAQMGVEYYYERAKTFAAASIPQSNGGFGNSAQSGRIQLLLKVAF